MKNSFEKEVVKKFYFTEENEPYFKIRHFEDNLRWRLNQRRLNQFKPYFYKLRFKNMI